MRDGISVQATEMIRLLEVEYERTATFIAGVTSTGVTIRGWAVTVWLAVLSLSISNELWQLALLTAFVAGVFFIIDGYHAWLYGNALEHAIRIERLSAGYYDALGRGQADPDTRLDFEVKLEKHRFGLYRSFGRFRWRELRFVRPYVIFRFFYPLLVAVALAVGVALLTLSSPSRTEEGCVITQTARGISVVCDGKQLRLDDR